MLNIYLTDTQTHIQYSGLSHENPVKFLLNLKKIFPSTADLLLPVLPEDNNLENIEELKKKISQHTESYKSYFNTLDKKYNSGIFENPDVILNVNENTLKEIVENLYFPNVSYDFSIIDLSILSRIYENFLQMEIIFDENENIKLEKTKSAKIKAVISTPDSIVKLMVSRALKDKIDGLSPDEILKLRICDLAVGSGIFFIESYNFI